MPPRQERLPIPDERIEAVGQWIQDNYRPVLRVITEGEQLDEAPRQEFEIREYQLEAWATVWDARQAGADRGLVHLATGLGKTSVGVFDFLKFREECRQAGLPEPRGLFVSHQADINEQAAERFQQYIPDLEVGFFDTQQKQLPQAGITFANVQGLTNKLSEIDPSHFDYIIYDEAHHMKAETWEAVVKHFTPRFRLALTATPDRMDRRDIRDHFGEEIYSKGLAEAIAEGWLVDVDYHIVFDDIVKEAMESGFEPKTLKEFRELFKIRPRNEVIAKNVREERHRIGLDDAKTMVFCESVEHAEEMAELLGGAAYHSGIEDRDARKRILRDFRAGTNQVICTVDMFNEGIDIPDARLVVFLRSTQSGTIFEQQLGRGLRRASGKDRVAVLDFVANIERIAKVRELSQNIRNTAVGNQGDGTTVCSPGENDIDIIDAAGGLHIHGQHSEFDFDKLAVDLLEKYGAIIGAREDRWHADDPEEIIRRALELKPDGPLTMDELNALSKAGKFMSGTGIVGRFGSISEFQKACGFEVLERIDTRNITNDELVALARQISPDSPLGKRDIAALSKEGRFIGAGTVITRFGSILQFQQACGFDIKGTRLMTNDDLVARAKELNPEGPLGFKQIEELSKQNLFPSTPTIVSRFGSLAEFYKACGFEAPLRTQEEVLERAQALKPNGPLSSVEIDKLSKDGSFVSVSYISKLFGSVIEFQKACGFEPSDRKVLTAKTTDEELIARALEISPDSPLGQKEIAALSREGRFAGVSNIAKRFGSIIEFQKACGFEPSNQSVITAKLTNDEIIAKAKQLKPTGVLTASEITGLSKQGDFVSQTMIRNRFGSIKAFQTACEQVE